MDDLHDRSSTGPLTVRLEGPAVKNHRIALRDLVLLGTHLQTAVDRVARVLIGQRESTRPGRTPAEIVSCCTLELVSLREGSLVLVCDLPQRDQSTLFEDLGEESLSVLVEGIGRLSDGRPLPEAFDAGVMLAVRESGKLLERGLDQISFELQTRRGDKRASYTSVVHANLVSRIQQPTENRRAIEGRLLMGDFKESARRCRLHLPAGGTVGCRFGEAQAGAVLAALTKHVRVFGETSEVGGDVVSLAIEDIEVLDSAPEEGSGSEAGSAFYDVVSDLTTLASEQGVGPLEDLTHLAADFWPSDESAAEFVAAVNTWRSEDRVANANR
jgi:hypothetical protein